MIELYQKRIADSLETLSQRDPAIAAAWQDYGMPDLHLREPGFASLAQIVVAQQVSTASAEAVWTRLLAASDGVLTPEGFLELGPDGWREAGLTRPKQRYLQALADAILRGEFMPDHLIEMDDATAMATLTARPGFGRWSAEIYLLMALRRQDVFPAGDLAIRLGYQDLRAIAEPPKENELRNLAQAWQPHRSAAALMLWHLYLSRRRRR